MSTEKFYQSNTGALSVEKLPDGSTAVVDRRSNSVHSLNASATQIWEACANGATFAEIQSALEKRAGEPVDAMAIRQGLAQLQRAKLIESESPLGLDDIDIGRRSLLKRVGAAGAFAIPVVLTLTASEQRAYAFQSLSGTTPAPTTTLAPTTTPAPTTTLTPPPV